MADYQQFFTLRKWIGSETTMIKNRKGSQKKLPIKASAIFSLIFFLTQISIPSYVIAEEIQPISTTTSSTSTSTSTQSTYQVFTPFKPYEPATVSTIGTTTTVSSTSPTSTYGITSPTLIAGSTAITSVSDDPDGTSTDTSFLQSTSPLSEPTQTDPIFQTPTTSTLGTDTTSTNSITEPLSITTIQDPFSPVETTPPPTTSETETVVTSISGTGGPTTIVDVDETSGPVSTGTIGNPTTTDIDETSNPATTGNQGTNPIPSPATTGDQVTDTNPETNQNSPRGEDPDGSVPTTSPSTPAVTPTPNQTTTPFDALSRSRNDERSQGGGGGPSGQFLNAERYDRPRTSQNSLKNQDFVGGGIGTGLRVLTLLLKGKGKAAIKKDISQAEKLQSEEESKNLKQLAKSAQDIDGKKKKMSKKLLKKLNKLNAEEELSEEEQAKAQILEQAGAVEADLSNLENAKSIFDESVKQMHNDSKQSPFGLEVVSDLAPVHQILSNKDLSFNSADGKPKQIVRPPAKQQGYLSNMFQAVARPVTQDRLFQVAKSMSPATIHRVHQIASPNDAGIHIQKFDSMGDPDL